MLNERLVSTVDIEKILQSDDLVALNDLLLAYRERRSWMDMLRGVNGRVGSSGILLRGLAESALAALDEQGRPAISAITTIRVDRRLTEIHQDARWSIMTEAREEGASWQDIAAAFGSTGEDAGEVTRTWYADRITALAQENLCEHDVARAQAVIDDQPPAAPEPANPAAGSGEPSSPVAES